MKNTKTVKALLKENARKAKKLFDLCGKYGEGIHFNFHIIENSQFPLEKKEYRVYHSDGYCFDVSKEEMELAEDEICNSCINGYEYSFNEGVYDGFKEITIEDAIKLIEGNDNP